MTGFDGVSSISREMCAKLAGFGIPADRIHELRNWAEILSVRPLDGPSPFRAEWDIRTPHVALYSGNIANKQGVEILVEAARLLRDRADLTFVICGQGPNRAALEASAAGLGNMLFRDLQPAERLGDLLGLATIHLLPQSPPPPISCCRPSSPTCWPRAARWSPPPPPGTGLAREIHGCGLATPPDDAPGLRRRDRPAARRSGGRRSDGHGGAAAGGGGLGTATASSPPFATELVRLVDAGRGDRH